MEGEHLLKESCCDTFGTIAMIFVCVFSFDFGLRIDVFSRFWFVWIPSWSRLGTGVVASAISFTSSGGV